MAIVGTDIVKEFGHPPQRILHSLNFKIEDGEFVSISGRSGSGKSTLLYIISTLDNPTSGKLEIGSRDIAKMSQKEIHEFRNKEIGFIFQFHYLLPEFTAIENILLPARNLGLQEQKRQEAKEALKRLGIEDKENHLPSEMSGGEQQRVAIARALIMQPRYIFADEPTGNLDSENATNVMSILRSVNEQMGTSIVLVTHEQDFAKKADREIFLADGRIIDEYT